MKTSKSEKSVIKYVVDVRSAKSAGRWGGYVRVWAKPIFEDGTIGTGHNPLSITIAYSVYGRSSGGPKTDLGRALASASARVTERLIEIGECATEARTALKRAMRG